VQLVGDILVTGLAAGMPEAESASLQGRRADGHPADDPAGGQHQGPGEGLTRGLEGERLQAGGGQLELLMVQVLNVHEPPGLTAYGWRREQEARGTRITPPAVEETG
jgi:hypothetical protein